MLEVRHVVAGREVEVGSKRRISLSEGRLCELGDDSSRLSACLFVS